MKPRNPDGIKCTGARASSPATSLKDQSTPAHMSARQGSSSKSASLLSWPSRRQVMANTMPAGIDQTLATQK